MIRAFSIFGLGLCFAFSSYGQERTGALAGGSRLNLTNALRYPALVVKDTNGVVMPLFSLRAYRAEFSHLRRVYHQMDLSARGVETDGWTYNIPEAEWPLMGFCYFGYACANLARADEEFRAEALAEMRWLLDALQTPRLTGFITAHFGLPFGPSQIQASTFVHGHFLSLAVRYREVSGDKRYDALIHRVAEALHHGFKNADEGILRSYRDMWWLSDNCPSLAALARYDRLFGRNLSVVKTSFVQNVQAYYLDKLTGLMCTYVNPAQHRQIQGARGISTMYALHHLRDFDNALAVQQYALAKKHFIREAMGFTAVREFAEGASGRPDVDSGPIILGLGPSASGFAIAAAAVMEDDETAWQLLKAAALVGAPVLEDGALRYQNMPPVGQAVVFYGKTLLLPD